MNLVRDRWGLKPVFYRETDGTAVDAPAGELDREGLADYLAFGFVPAPRTMFRGVRKLAAEGASPAQQRELADFEGPDALAAEVRERLRAAVREHLRAAASARVGSGSDSRTVGVVLTGDASSGLLCALAAEESGGSLATFSAGGRAAGADQARLVADQYGTEHHEIEIDGDRLGRLMAACHEPLGDPEALPLLLAVDDMAATRCDVVLTSAGADELFGGHDAYLPFGVPSAVNRVAGILPGERARTLATAARLPALDAHLAAREVFGPQERRRLLGEQAPADVQAAWRERFVAAEADTADEVTRLQVMDAALPLADGLLAALARVAPGHRAPYLDDGLAALALSLPTQYKVRGLTTKRLLRRAALPLLPGAVVHAPRASAGHAWLMPLAREVLAPERISAQGVFDAAEVARVLEAGEPRRVWTLVAFGLWLEHVGKPRARLAGVA
jgi:asparagine synthase (glutamine-hydrolysing)